MPVSNPQSFRNEARFQRVCARRDCQRGGSFHAHHVVDEAILRDRCHIPKKDRYDTRNALRLCQGLGDPDRRCHFSHEHRVEGYVVKTVELTDDNLEYAFEVLGDYAADYLRREYDDSELDPRIIELEHEYREAA